MASDAVTFALEKIGNLINQEVALLYGVKGDVEDLQSKLQWIKSFLTDAERKNKSGDERIKNWITEVRDVSFRIENAIDTFMLQIEHRRQKQRRGGILGTFNRYVCFPSELKYRHEIGEEIQRIKGKLDQINKSRMEFGILSLDEPSSSTTEISSALRQKSPLLDDDAVIVGFDDNKKLIMEQLLRFDMERRCVLSIVGMGGLGKTTLATKIYNNDEITRHFPTRVWVTVSNVYMVSDIFKRIIKDITKSDTNKTDEEDLKIELHEILKERKYLVVLDDIWESQVWEKIKSGFPNDMNGSRVLFTTRFLDVAKAAEPNIPPYELSLLSEEQSWELFLRKVFRSEDGTDPTCPEELEIFGRDIVKRCGGLPLAVVVLGGLFSTKDRSYNVWRDVARSMDWEATRDGNECMKILALSYDDLPNHMLKSCFKYLGSFPEDYDISAWDVIRMWMAEDYIPIKHNETIEETGMNYIYELSQRSMIQNISRRSYNDRVKSFRIHDLFRDLCISLGKDEVEHKFGSLTTYETNVKRRLILGNCTYDREFSCSSSNPRAILGFEVEVSSSFIRSTFCVFKLLRVVYLSLETLMFRESSIRIKWKLKKIVPDEITSLLHLRYLKLECLNSEMILPSSMGNLSNLQTLDITNTWIYNIPTTLWEIQTLRHVRADYIENFNLHRRHLGNLQTFDRVKAGTWIQKCLASLSNIRVLSIYEIKEKYWDALRDSLSKLNLLNTLTLDFTIYTDEIKIPSSNPIESIQNHENLRCLRIYHCSPIYVFPKNLTKLYLGWCRLDEASIAEMGKLPGLEILHLIWSLNEWKMICNAGAFPRLQKLRIRDNSLTYWRTENGSMKNLTDLTLHWSSNLKTLLSGLEHIRSLKKLTLDEVPTEWLNTMEEGGEYWYMVRHIPCISVVRQRVLQQTFAGPVGESNDNGERRTAE